MSDAKLLMEAGRDIDTVDVVSDHQIRIGAIDFTRRAGEKNFKASGGLDNLGAIHRKYSELGVKRWAKSKGYTVRQKAQQLVLTRY